MTVQIYSLPWQFRGVAIAHSKLTAQAVGFSDCLVLEVARKAGHVSLGTFNRDFSKVADVRDCDVAAT